MYFIKFSALLPALCWLFSNPVNATQRIAVLNFELNDITALPNTPEEQHRTASFRPLLEQAMSRTGDYEIIDIPNGVQASANSSFGYLFRFHDLAAKLGKQFGADWVIVAQHSKPSFLYSHLWVHLIHINTQTLSERYAIELKGTHETVTLHGIKSLTQKIQARINR